MMPSLNRRRALRALAGAVASAFLLNNRDAHAAEEKKIELSKLPAKAREAADQRITGVKWTQATMSDENGEVSYELEGKSAKGREVILEVTADGKVTKVEQDISMADLPANVRQAAQNAVPRAKWSEARKHEDGDEVYYVLDGKINDKRDVTAEITAQGKVTEIEKEIPLKQVPQAVSAALKGKWPRFTPSSVFEISQEGKVVSYEFEGKRPRDKQEITVSVAPDGKTVEIVEDK
jgi:biopolymer transport protein ExbD